MERAVAELAIARSTRRQLVLAVAGLALLVGCGLRASPAPAPAKVPRVGFLSHVSPQPYQEPLWHALRGLGYVEGQNIAIEYRSAEGRDELLPVLAAELVGLRVDVIVAASTPAIQAAKQATQTIPIVMVAPSDPVGTGLVASLPQPGGNVTGLSILSPRLSAKGLELLRDIAPEVSRVAVLWNPSNPGTAIAFRETQVAARALGVQLQSLEVRSLQDLEGAFEAATRERADALLPVLDPLTVTHRARIVAFAAQSRLPAMYPIREYVDDGGLMAYGLSLSDQHRRAATYVDKILKGARPDDLPVEPPMRFELVINLRTAQALGFAIPQSVLLLADEVIP